MDSLIIRYRDDVIAVLVLDEFLSGKNRNWGNIRTVRSPHGCIRRRRNAIFVPPQLSVPRTRMSIAPTSPSLHGGMTFRLLRFIGAFTFTFTIVCTGFAAVDDAPFFKGLAAHKASTFGTYLVCHFRSSSLSIEAFITVLRNQNIVRHPPGTLGEQGCGVRFPRPREKDQRRLALTKSQLISLAMTALR
jgi:hypothetical protein